MKRARAVAAWGLAVLATAALAVSSAAPPAPAREAFRARLAAQAPLLALARAGDRLVAVGDFGVVLLSDDQGRTWRQAASVAAREMLTSVTFVDPARGFAVGHGGTIIATTDGGEHWTRIHEAGADNVLLSVWFGNARTGVAVGAFGFAIATADGGATWTPLTPGDGDDRDRHLNAIFAGPADTLFVAAEAGTVFRSPTAGGHGPCCACPTTARSGAA